MSHQAHWEQVYLGKGDGELSWFQRQPAVSLGLFDAIHPTPQRVVDVGGGQSLLAGELLARCVEHLCVLDVSPAALDRAKARLGAAAARVHWVVADVLHAPDLGSVDLWHDRAVFHFLTEPSQRQRYVECAASAVVPGGHMILATFALTGPEKCSGLPVCRYDAAAIAREFEPQFELVASATETHTTPWGKPQDFAYAVLQRSATGPLMAAPLQPSPPPPQA